MFRILRMLRLEALASPGMRRYALYACGELILVVVGILIALQINNWNEERIARNEIRAYALNLSDAITRDMEMLAPVEMQIRASIRQSEVLSAYLRDRSIDQMANVELYFLTTHIGYRPYAWNRAAMEQLKAAGGLRQMRNRDLAERISDYEALTLHLDQDYREDEETAREMFALMSELIDLNYDDEAIEAIMDWPDGFTEADIEQRLTRYQETEAFKRLAARQRPLLSSDLAAFRRLANISARSASRMQPRPDIELPRLRQFATEIQTLIDAEYR